MGEFAPPGPGHWALDRSHFTGATTPIVQEFITASMGAGTGRVFAELGAPVKETAAAFVNGYMYTRVVPLIRGDKPATKLPPLPVLKLVARVHPEFRRRARAAGRTLAEMPSLEIARRWPDERAELIDANRSFQAVDLATISDDGLERHVGELLDHVRANYERHFWLHGHDLGPLARFVHACEGWGIPGADAVAALAGASPSTTGHTGVLVRLRTLVEAADRPVESLDDVRALGDEARELLDSHLERHGQVLATGYDITSFRLAELPGVVLDSIRTARPAPARTGDDVAALRDRVPVGERERFDEYLEHARTVMDMRDDNGPLTAEWPTGLLRGALLEVGRRLAARGALAEPDDALDLTVAEARRALSGPIPDASEMTARRAARVAQLRLDPPATLGPDEPEPPLDVLPGDLPALVAMVKTAMRHLGMDGAVGVDGMVGVGVGVEPYVGRARRAESADEAIESLEPGDVLVVRATSPAFNAVLTIAGAVVTADGGAMSHAAVLARELGIPAVVGAHDALGIADGALIEVDPRSGRVRVVETA